MSNPKERNFGSAHNSKDNIWNLTTVKSEDLPKATERRLNVLKALLGINDGKVGPATPDPNFYNGMNLDK